MNQPAKAQEPSMEEILASIRRIIADDDTKPAKPEPAKPEPQKPAAAAPAPAPPPPPKAPPPAPAAEPAAMSQDDIDAMLAGFEQPPPAAEPPPEPEADILDLTEAMAAPAPEPTFRTIGTESDVMFAEAEPEPEPPRPAAPPPRPPVHAVPAAPAEPPILSASATAAVDAAFNSLAQTVLVHNAKTLEDLVKEMLRPMLKSWLDDNLPNLVERLVRAEIERVSRGRG
jgi:cell pole-organizing protein PopZ